MGDNKISEGETRFVFIAEKDRAPYRDDTRDRGQRGYRHPQPAELSEVFNEALAVGDGTVNGAVVYWHQRALAAEAKLSEVGGDCGEVGMQQVVWNDSARLACLESWAREPDGLLLHAESETGRRGLGLGENCGNRTLAQAIDGCATNAEKNSFAALAATGKQQVGEVVEDDRFPNGFADAIAYANEMEDAAGAMYDALTGYESDGSDTGTELIRKSHSRAMELLQIAKDEIAARDAEQVREVQADALAAVVADIRAHCSPPNPESDDEVSAAYALSWADRIEVIASRQPVCETCSGWGRIGGPSFYAPDEGGDPCPECNSDAPPAQGIDLGQLKVEVQRLRKRTDPALGEKAMYVRLDAVLALIDGRDAGTGVE